MAVFQDSGHVYDPFMHTRSLGFYGLASLTGLALSACKSDPPPQPVPQVSISAGDDDTAGETGNEGDDDALPAGAGTAAAPGAGGAALLSELNRIVGRVKESSYSHKTHVDEGGARYEVDCSGLLDYALARVCPDALDAVPRSSGSGKRPLAKHYVELIDGLAPGQKKGRWKRIGKAAELAPGDVVAWLKPQDVTSNNTGHIMVVRAPVTSAGGEVTVPIIDSTSVRHGGDDSRYASKSTGVGIGTIHLIVNEHGAPVGYRWSNGKKARNHSTVVALGRIE
jgi:hypothetical protein